MADKKCNCGCEKPYKEGDTVLSPADIVHMWNTFTDAEKDAKAKAAMNQQQYQYPPQYNTRVTADGANMDIAEIISDYTDEYEETMNRKNKLLLDEDGSHENEIACLQKILDLQADLLVEKILRLSTQPCSEQEVKQMVQTYNDTLDYIRANHNTAVHFDKEKDDSEQLKNSLLNICDEYEENATTLMIYKVSGLAR